MCKCEAEGQRLQSKLQLHDMWYTHGQCSQKTDGLEVITLLCVCKTVTIRQSLKLDINYQTKES